jgi:hypothetical protein
VALKNNFPAINEFLKKVEEVQAAEAAKRAKPLPSTDSVAVA